MSELIGKSKGWLSDALSVLLIIQYPLITLFTAYFPPIEPLKGPFWDNLAVAFGVGVTYHFAAAVLLVIRYISQRYGFQITKKDTSDAK